MTVNPAIDAIASRLEPRLASAFLAAIVEIQKGVGVAALARALKSGNLTAALYALATGDIPAKLARAAKVVNEVFALAGVSAMAALPPAAAETLHETGYAIGERDWVATVELLDQLHAQMFSDE